MDWKNLFPKENRYFETDNGILYCGDCIEIMSKMPYETIDAIITDPPYLINYRTNHRKNKTHQFCKPIHNDNNQQIIEQFIKYSYLILKNNSPLYCFASWKTEDIFLKLMRNYKFNIKNQIVWVKNNWTAGDLEAQYGQQYEIILYANKGRCKLKGKRYSDVWYFKRVSGKNQIHQNQKPIELIEFIINNSTKENDIILDPFVGSGTTSVLSEITMRRWISIEIDEKYCEIAKQRILNRQ